MSTYKSPRWPAHRDKTTGLIGIYNHEAHLCACRGTGLVPTNEERRGEESQAYCPYHKCTRYWPQLQADGSTKFYEIISKGLTNKELTSPKNPFFVCHSKKRIS